MSDECECGHVLDEHETNGRLFQKCTIDGCDCLDFEPIESDDDPR